MNPVLLRRRQLVLREAGRFPDLARKYHESWPRRTIEVLATVFDRLPSAENYWSMIRCLLQRRLRSWWLANRLIRRCFVAGDAVRIGSSIR
jgi:hypothetical protein